jgi:hypothetical protein
MRDEPEILRTFYKILRTFYKILTNNFLNDVHERLTIAFGYQTKYVKSLKCV